MNLLYIDASAGLSGDMLLASLLDLGLPLSSVPQTAYALKLPPLSIKTERVNRAGYSATRVSIRARREDPSLRHADHLFRCLREAVGFSRALRERIFKVVSVLAGAEGAVHGVSSREVVFQQLGRVDTLVAVAGFCAGLDYFGIDRVHVSPVPVGQWHQDHDGAWKAEPGPATVKMLKRFPTRFLKERFEWTTPTGSALIAALAKPGTAPPFTLLNVGYSVGHRQFPGRAGVLKALIGREFRSYR